MRDNLMMVPHLTLLIDPSIKTGCNYVYITAPGYNCFEFIFDRNRLIKFFKELLVLNNNLELCYSMSPPTPQSRNRFLVEEVPISFACFLSYAEAAAYKNVPIYLFPLPNFLESAVEPEPGKPLNFHDFDNIFGLKLDSKSVPEIKKKIRMVGPVSDISYPTETKAKKIDSKSLNLSGHLNVRHVSSDAIVDLLAKGTNIVVPSENNEYKLISLSHSAHWVSRDDFGVSWKMQNDENASCNILRVPILIKSNEIFYSKRGAEFMNIFKKELEELSQKNKSNVSSNPFHNEVKEKPAEEIQSDSEYHEVSNVQYDFSKEVKKVNETTETAEAGSSKSAPANESGGEAPKSDGEEEPLSARQLFNFMTKFKAEMKGEIVDMVEETVKKYSAKEKVDGVSGSKKDAEKRSAINVNDCVKSEADDSDLPKLLNTLSQIEEQLSSIENAANSDMASSKPHKYNMHGYVHGHHRRGRDFSNMTRRATLGILKKRMKGSVVELESDLCAISKSGFKLKMARNVSQSFRFVLFKYGKYRNSKFEIDFMPTVVPSGGIECCVKPVNKGQDKSQADDKGQYTFYEVRFKSKERTGKFRCYLKILRNGKVCGNPLCITVRVKRFHSASDQIDSAEEALPCYSGPRGSCFGGFEPTSPANVDVDEGISVFHEYPSSPSSDSEDGEATARDNENDEGIDTKLDASCSAFEKLSMNEKRTFSIFDEDSDSSVSLLLDENEVREIVDKDFDSVKIPACFIPNADMSKEPMSIRVKRKINSTRKKKSDSPLAPPKIRFKKREWSGRPPINQMKNTGTDQVTDESHHNPYLYHRMKRDSEAFFEKHHSSRFFKETKDAGNSASETVTAPKDTYKSLYPTLDELRETPVKTKKSTESKETQSPVAILPEKVFEMTSNVFKSVMNSMKQPNDVKENMQKNIDETLWSISRSVFGGLTQQSSSSTHLPGAAPASTPVSCSPTPASSTPPPASFTLPTADQASRAAAWQTPLAPQSAFGPPLLSCIPPVMSSGGTFPAAANSVPSAPTEPLAMPNTTTPASKPSVNVPLQEEPFWTASFSQAPKAVPKAAASDSNADVPVFAFPDPRFAPPPPSFAPSANSCFTRPPTFAPVDLSRLRSGRMEPNTPNVTRTMSAPFMEVVESVRAPVVNSPAQSVDFTNTQKPFSAETNVPTTDAETPSATSTSIPTGESPQPNQPKRSGLIAGEEYNRLEPDVRQKILQLNEMGFMNDSYNVFLIRKYPQDMDKVVESLVNYNDF